MAALAVISFAVAINVVMGVFVARAKRRAVKLLFIHLPVPVLIWLRHELALDTYFIIFTITAAIAGLLTGKWLSTRWEQSRQRERES